MGNRKRHWRLTIRKAILVGMSLSLVILYSPAAFATISPDPGPGGCNLKYSCLPDDYACQAKLIECLLNTGGGGSGSGGSGGGSGSGGCTTCKERYQNEKNSCITAYENCTDDPAQCQTLEKQCLNAATANYNTCMAICSGTPPQRTLSESASSQWTHEEGLRRHYVARFGQDQLQVSVIDRSRGKSASLNKTQFHFIILVDAGTVYGRWVVRYTSHGDLDGRHSRTEVHLQLLDTGEKLTVYSRLNLDTGRQSRYASFGGHLFDFRQPGTLSAVGPRTAAGNFLGSVASPLFLKGANLLWIMSHQMPQACLMPCASLFDSFFGSLAKPAGGQDYTLQATPVDPSFDAVFGFPCSQQEVPLDIQGTVYGERLPQGKSLGAKQLR